MLKNGANLRQGYGRQASDVPCLRRGAASRRQVALLPNLRAHRLAALRGVRAHVLRVHSARQAYSAEVSYEGREWLRPFLRQALDRTGRTLRKDSGHAFLNIPST